MNEDHPTATSQVRANTVSTIAEGIRVGQAASSQGISQKQIGMILALVTSIATAVATCLMVIYGGLTGDLRDDHAAVISRMEASHAGSLARIESMYGGRVNDLKATGVQFVEALESCLESRND